ncbi:hypothetical protein [Burkholderia anthina]|uniref:hypothetical protein n=1 Tax=Burkholderia anthina TaxID=179879 RepID=UPI0037C1653D
MLNLGAKDEFAEAVDEQAGLYRQLRDTYTVEKQAQTIATGERTSPENRAKQ